MSDDTPVLDTLTDITAASVEHNTLSPRDFMLARVAALIAADAPPMHVMEGRKGGSRRHGLRYESAPPESADQARRTESG